MVAVAGNSRGVGRPRAQGPSHSGRTTRQDVLTAAAELFTALGYSATSTRAVAERAGLRQASLYHHFAGKEDILAALLEGTVQPSLELARRLAAERGATPAGRLWALCRADAALLAGGPHNLGALYLLPEVRAERFAGFRRLRAELKQYYAELLTAAGPAEEDPAIRADLVFGLVESVILLRRETPERDPARLADATADAALRIAGCAQSLLGAVREEGRTLL
ncbi:TetR/AcrR family transcriptional regulator [Peterkaempfera griseoplana]|uniref:TetR/AcrR family transcriptional regulator n=1 Tax=Peterkaempfera griseoplana TaxID=66896 RepID=UPI0006E28373|nr:TetR/AcrR family transcriptional regulator [Peterkaempfera griseoplana]